MVTIGDQLLLHQQDGRVTTQSVVVTKGARWSPNPAGTVALSTRTMGGLFGSSLLAEDAEAVRWRYSFGVREAKIFPPSAGGTTVSHLAHLTSQIGSWNRHLREP